jgi:DNA repair exonuclease SbcCD ATPase subunit
VKALTNLRFGREPEKEAEEQRVVQLFRNRAELKKAYASLQDEIHRLKDRLKQQEGATARIQEMLEALEARLAEPGTAYPALVFYQLRGLWGVGRELISQLVADLARQQEEKERRQHLTESNRKQFARRQALEAQLREAETTAAESVARQADTQRRLASLTKPWHYFKRRDLAHRLQALAASAKAAAAALDEARGAHDALASEQAAEFPGLSVEARRAINLAAIGYAEMLCLRLARTPLVAQAKDAAARREVIDDYGTREECERLMADIARAKAVLQHRSQLSQELRTRTDRLRQLARYRDGGETVPTPESIGMAEGDVLDRGAQGASATRLPNVLAEDTWDLFRVVLR